LLSSTDPLTQVYNRRYVLERAEAELLRVRRYGGAFSILLLDIDHFKQVNDTHGHLAGDAVLRAVSNLFRGQVRPTDVVGRYGGEEFLVLLPETYHTEACEVAERFRKSLAAMVVTYEQVKLQITTSIGVAFGTCRTENLDTVLAAADQVLYKAKHNGRNQVVVEALTNFP
jgi:diguanylate cyclase (GGDEF)-like protein